jgi:hypothetical protein
MVTLFPISVLPPKVNLENVTIVVQGVKHQANLPMLDSDAITPQQYLVHGHTFLTRLDSYDFEVRGLFSFFPALGN